jgi:hypothetical protein
VFDEHDAGDFTLFLHSDFQPPVIKPPAPLLVAVLAHICLCAVLMPSPAVVPSQ